MALLRPDFRTSALQNCCGFKPPNLWCIIKETIKANLVCDKESYIVCAFIYSVEQKHRLKASHKIRSTTLVPKVASESREEFNVILFHAPSLDILIQKSWSNIGNEAQENEMMFPWPQRESVAG